MIGNDQRQFSRAKWILIGLFVLWLAISLGSYYLVQNAYIQPQLAGLGRIRTWLPLRLSPMALGRTFLNVVATLWISVAALGVGRWLLRRLSLPDLEVLEELLFGLSVGFGCLGIVILSLGVLGLLQVPILVGLTLMLTLLTGRQSAEFLRRLRRPQARGLVWVFLAIAIGLAITLAFLPPTSWDGLFYHLTGPKLYLQAGRIEPGIDIPHLNFPALFEMLFLLGMGVRSDIAAVLLHFLFGLLLAGLVFATARRHLQVNNAWLAVLLLYSIPMVLSLAGWAYNDLALAFFALASLYTLLIWRDSPEARSYLVLSSILSGFAMGMKYTSFVVPLTLIILILWWFRKKLRQAFQPIVLFSGVALLVVSPWLIRNLVFTGNPVYPFIFGGEFWDDFRADAYAETGTGIGFNPETCEQTSSAFLVGQHASECDVDLVYLARRLVTLPYDLTLGLEDVSQDGVTGPLFLILLPLLLAYVVSGLGNNRSPAFNALSFFALTQYIFWAIGVVFSAALWQSRLLLPAFVALCPVMAWILEDLARIDHPRFSLQRLLFLVVAGVLLVGLMIQFVGWLPHQPWAYTLGAETREEYLQRRLGAHYTAIQAINEQVPVEDAVAFLWEPRSYYCRPDCRADSILDTLGHMEYLYGDAESVSAAWQAQGISHVLLFRAGLDFVLQANSPTEEPLDEPLILRELTANHFQLIDSIGDDTYQLFRLRTQ